MNFPPAFLDDLRARIPVSEVVRARVKLQKRGHEWAGLSPFNQEKTPSFFVNDQKGFYHDFSSGKHGDAFAFLMETQGISFPEAVEHVATMAGVPLPRTDGRPEKAMNGASTSAEHRLGDLIKTYDYIDGDGELVLQVCRYEPKTFRQRRRPRPGDDPEKIRDGWIWSVKGIEQVPYRLGDVLEAASSESLIFVVEGEKDADNLAALGAPATCNAQGAGKWPKELNQYFRDADVIVIGDNDEAGREHKRLVAASLTGTVRRIRTLDLPGRGEMGDVTDWIEAGGTIEALYELVDRTARDWSPSADPIASAFGGAFIHDLSGRALKRDWIVKGVFLARTLGLVLGPPGCGKSFLILDLCMSLALAAAQKQTADARWFGRKIFPCGIAYIAAEGQDDFLFRIRAWLHAKGLPENTRMPFYLIPTAVDMRSDKAATEKLAQEIAAASKLAEAEFGVPISINVVDTVNRALAGGNENAPEVMGTFVGNCTQLREITKGTTLAIHHTTEDRPRGHGSLHGGSDAEILVKGAFEGRPNTWLLKRSKAGPTGARHEFRLGSHKLGADEDGEDITSCVVLALGAEPSHEDAEMRDATEAASTRAPSIAPDGSAILGDNLRTIVEALQAAINEHGGEPVPADIRVPHGRRLVTHKQWLAEIVRVMPGDDKDSDKFRDKCRKARDAAALRLRTRNLIGMDGAYVWRTERRVWRVDIPARASESRTQVSDLAPELSETMAGNSGFGGRL